MIKSWTTTPKMLFINAKNRKFALKKTDSLYQRVLSLLLGDHHDTVLDILSKDKQVMAYTNNEFSVDENGQVFLHGETRPVDRIVAEKLIAFTREAQPYQILISFWKNLSENPSEWARKQLYGFLSKNKHPITDDGMFVAYKKVRMNDDGVLKDIHSGEFINNIGHIVQMKRELVDPNPNQTCSTGLHVASFDYANSHYGSSNDVLLTVLVNPKDVVAVPADYNNQKMRVCEYAVIGVASGEMADLYLSNDRIIARMKDGLKQNIGFNFSGLTSKQIVQFVKLLTGEEINCNFKSKQSIVNHAERIFAERELLAV